MGDVHEIDARADHILEPGACVLQRLGDDVEDGAGLRRGIADADHLAARACGGAADGDDIATAPRARSR